MTSLAGAAARHRAAGNGNRLRIFQRINIAYWTGFYHCSAITFLMIAIRWPLLHAS